MRLQSADQHPHGLSDADFDGYFPPEVPTIFAFHGYPWLIHRLAYRRHGHANLHVRGYKERGTRSEEHTSELQSLMRISYAVFCLQKKHITKRLHRHTAN